MNHLSNLYVIDTVTYIICILLAPFEDSFALLPDVTHDKIYQVSLSNGELRALDIPDIDVPVSIIYDKPTKKLYWTNAIKTEIRSSPLKAAVSEILYDTCKF